MTELYRCPKGETANVELMVNASKTKFKLAGGIVNDRTSVGH